MDQSITNGAPSPDTEQAKRLERLSIYAKVPRAKRRLNRKTILVISIVLSSAVGLVVIEAFSSRSERREMAEVKTLRSQPGEIIKNLPDDYSKIPKPPKLGPPLRGELGPVQVAYGKQMGVISRRTDPSAEEKFFEEMRLEKLKKALQARESEVSFSGIKVESGQVNTIGRNNDALHSLQENIAPGPNARDADNRQDDKIGFLKSTKDDDIYLHASLQSPLSDYQVMAGSIIPGVLLTGINSDLPGQIIGQISQNVFDTVLGDHLLLPQGSRIIGEYDSRVAYGQERVLVVWTRIILPNGKSINLEGMPGVDLTGYAGLEDGVDNHYGRLLSGVVLGSVLGAGAQVAQGSTRVDPTFGQLAAQGFAQNINEAGQQITRKNLNIQPTLEISPGQRFNVFVTKDMVLEPYDEER